MSSRIERRARAALALVRDRAQGTTCRIMIERPRRVEEGWLLTVRVRNNGRPAAFDASVLVHDENGLEPARLHVPWRDERPSSVAQLALAATRVLRIAIAPPNGARPDFAILTVDETRGLAKHHVRRDPVALTVVIAEQDGGRVVAEQAIWLSYGHDGDANMPQITTAPPAGPASPIPPRGVPPVASSSETRGAPGARGLPRAVDVAPHVGLGFTTRTYGAVVFDYNNDGWPDIFLGRHDAPAYLLRNDHGHFVFDPMEFPGTDRHCAAAGDINGNGRLDLFCVIGGHSGHGPKPTPNELWMQQADGTFVNEGDQPGLLDPYGRGREAVLLDVNGNGLLDILVGNVSPRSDDNPSPNRFFLNEGNGGFRPAPEFGLDLEYSVGGAGRPGSQFGGGNWPMGRLATLDADGNGRPDVVMCAKRPQDTFQRVHFFRNEGGTRFQEATDEVGLGGIVARDLALVDMTGDGQLDLVVVNGMTLIVCLNDHGHFRVAYKMPVQDAFRVAAADATGNGHPDIYVMRTSSTPGPDIPDLLLLSRGSYDDYDTLELPTVEGNVRDDAVYAIDFDRDGRSEFLVLHGHSLNPAPIQLIALR